MTRYKLNLVTMSDVNDFIKIVSACPGEVKVSDEAGKYSCNGKSLLGILYSLEWDSVYCETELDIYSKIERFIID